MDPPQLRSFGTRYWLVGQWSYLSKSNGISAFFFGGDFGILCQIIKKSGSFMSYISHHDTSRTIPGAVALSLTRNVPVLGCTSTCEWTRVCTSGTRGRVWPLLTCTLRLFLGTSGEVWYDVSRPFFTSHKIARPLARVRTESVGLDGCALSWVQWEFWVSFVPVVVTKDLSALFTKVSMFGSLWR